MHGKTYASLNWRDRAAEVKLRAERVNDTLAGADAALSPYGIRLINERGLHVYEEWPGLDRRMVSGSVWDWLDVVCASTSDVVPNPTAPPASTALSPRKLARVIFDIRPSCCSRRFLPR